MNIDMTCPAGNGITIPLILPLVPIICPHRLRRRASILSRSKCRKYWCDAAAAAGDAASSPFAMPTIPSQTLAYNFPTRTTTTTTAAAYSYSASSTETTTRLRALSLYRRLTVVARSVHADAQSTELCTLLGKNQSDFRNHISLTDANEVDSQFRLVDTNEDSVLVQAEHLSRLFNDPEYQKLQLN